MADNLKFMNCFALEFFIYYFGLCLTIGNETTESQTTDKGGPLYMGKLRKASAYGTWHRFRKGLRRTEIYTLD